MNEMLVIPLEEWDRLVRLDSALRNPSDELIKRLINAYYALHGNPKEPNFYRQAERDGMHAVLAALADEFGVQR